MKYFSIFVFLALIVGCSSLVSSFEGRVGSVSQNSIEVDCSNAVNRDKKGAIPDIGYICHVDVTEDAIITDNNGKLITIKDLQQGQTVIVILKEKMDIREDKRDVIAKEIKVLSERMR